MRMPGSIVILAAGLSLGGAAMAAERPVVVELYTSQGCAACLTANQTANQLAQREGLIVLALPVDYWDYLGWKDTYARPAFAARQRAYARTLRRARGLHATDDRRRSAGLRRQPRARRGADRPAREARVEAPEMLFREDGRVAIGSGRTPKAGADVWLVRFDPRAAPGRRAQGRERAARP